MGLVSVETQIRDLQKIETHKIDVVFAEIDKSTQQKAAKETGEGRSTEDVWRSWTKRAV